MFRKKSYEKTEEKLVNLNDEMLKVISSTYDDMEKAIDNSEEPELFEDQKRYIEAMKTIIELSRRA